MTHSKLNPLSKIPFNFLSLINTLLLQEKTGVAKEWTEYIYIYIYIYIATLFKKMIFTASFHGLNSNASIQSGTAI